MTFPLIYTCFLEAPGQLFNWHKLYFYLIGKNISTVTVMLHQLICVRIESDFLNISANVFPCFILLLKSIKCSVGKTKKIRVFAMFCVHGHMCMYRNLVQIWNSKTGVKPIKITAILCFFSISLQSILCNLFCYKIVGSIERVIFWFCADVLWNF